MYFIQVTLWPRDMKLVVVSQCFSIVLPLKCIPPQRPLNFPIVLSLENVIFDTRPPYITGKKRMEMTCDP